MRTVTSFRTTGRKVSLHAPELQKVSYTNGERSVISVAGHAVPADFVIDDISENCDEP